MLRRRDVAQAHRRTVIAELIEHYDWVEPRSVDETMAALQRGPQLIVSPRLPDDVVSNRRTNVPLLWRLGKRDGRFIYAPIVVKNNEVVETATSRRMLEASLTNLSPVDAAVREGLGPRSTLTVTRNGLALAHATRVLQSLGHGDSEGHVAMVDRNQRVWWFNLASPETPRFNLDIYDAAFAEREHTVALLEQWMQGEVEYPTSPYWHRECEECPYRGECEGTLVERNDVSLVRYSTLEQQTALRRQGVTTVSALADLDPSLARPARGDADDAPREAVLARAIERLPDLIYRARVMTWGGFLRAMPASEVHCPTADVEVDVDMESYDDRTYLWGASVRTSAAVEGVPQGYTSFVTWEELTPEAERDVFLAFWQWLSGLRTQTVAAGHTFAAYCFWAQAENGAMDRALAAVGVDPVITDEVCGFRSQQPAQWIDMHEHAKRCIQTEGPLGLKHLARGAGFEWRDENPSGEASMLWYEVARGTGDEAIVSRQRILDYNEDDCRATAALRDWLNGGARDLPHRDGPRSNPPTH